MLGWTREHGVTTKPATKVLERVAPAGMENAETPRGDAVNSANTMSILTVTSRSSSGFVDTGDVLMMQSRVILSSGSAASGFRFSASQGLHPQTNASLELQLLSLQLCRWIRCNLIDNTGTRVDVDSNPLLSVGFYSVVPVVRRLVQYVMYIILLE